MPSLARAGFRPAALPSNARASLQADEAKALAAFSDPKGGYVDRDLYGRGLVQATGMKLRERIVLFTTTSQAIPV